MRVAIVQEQVDLQRGGAETSTLEMAHHLAARGVAVTVICAATDAATERLSDEAFRVHAVDTGRGSRVVRAVRFIAEADRYCRDERFDVVHAVTPCFSCNVYQPRGGTFVETVRRSVGRSRTWLGRLLRRFGRRFNRRQRFLLLVERAMLTDRNPPRVAALSRYVAQQIRAVFPQYPPERLHVVFNGVGIQPLAPANAQAARAAVRRELGIGAAAPLVLFVAHNFKLKGLGELLRAMAVRSQYESEPGAPATGQPQSEPAAPATGQPQSEPAAPATGQPQSEPEAPARAHHPHDGTPHTAWTLAVVGRDNPAPYRRRARQLGVLERTLFLGPRDDLAALYAAADGLAHPTWYDPCSRVVLEALCCGLPVVTTRFNGAAEIMEAGRHGVVLDSPRDTEALAAAMDSCLRPATRAACSADAPRLRERLSMARHARELQELYERALG